MGVRLFGAHAETTAMHIEHNRLEALAIFGRNDVEDVGSLTIAAIGDVAPHAFGEPGMGTARGQLASHRGGRA